MLSLLPCLVAYEFVCLLEQPHEFHHFHNRKYLFISICFVYTQKYRIRMLSDLMKSALFCEFIFILIVIFSIVKAHDSFYGRFLYEIITKTIIFITVISFCVLCASSCKRLTEKREKKCVIKFS
jgi:hypothetical protein